MSIAHRFKDHNFFTNKEIYNFYAEKEKEISKSTVNWRIYQLVQSGKISRIGRGRFIVGAPKTFKPLPKRKELKISKELKQGFPFLDYCIWNSNIIQELSIHQAQNHFIIVETDRDSLEAVFQHLKANHKHVYLKPTKDAVENYLLDIANPIIIQNLVSEAPTQLIKDLPSTSIEKLLVDLVSYKALFYFYQGYELINIFQRALEKYTVNRSTLFRYASRRKKKAKIQEILSAINRH
ncbi:MAG: DUF6577 family protein [Bacteroidota bacterium]